MGGGGFEVGCRESAVLCADARDLLGRGKQSEGYDQQAVDHNEGGMGRYVWCGVRVLKVSRFLLVGGRELKLTFSGRLVF